MAIPGETTTTAATDGMGNSDPLLKWNELNKQNAEQSILDAMFAAVAAASPIIDRFSTWLLAGTGAAAALLLAHLDSILPFLSPSIFKVCGFLLLVSGAFGFVAKFAAIQCQVGKMVLSEIGGTLGSIMDKHAQEGKRIAALAKQRNIGLDTDFDIANVLAKFLKPFPAWVRWLAAKSLAKNKDSAQPTSLRPMKACIWQGYFSALQTLTFVACIAVAFWFAHPVH